MPLECVKTPLQSTIVLGYTVPLDKDIHRVSGCYHFYPQAVDNYDVDCVA